MNNIIRSVVIITIAALLNSCNTNQNEKMNTENQTGLVTKVSSQSFEATYSKLKGIIENNPNLKILLELDHQKNASSVELELNPTRIIMFGNPKMGTPLMQASPTAGIDLPQKIIVYQEDDKTVKLSYNDPLYMKARHDISNKDEVLNKIGMALGKITDAAISK